MVTLDTGIAGSSLRHGDPALKIEAERSPEMSATPNKTDRRHNAEHNVYTMISVETSNLIPHVFTVYSPFAETRESS
jgi:hypothetical protein